MASTSISALDETPREESIKSEFWLYEFTRSTKTLVTRLAPTPAPIPLALAAKAFASAFDFCSAITVNSPPVMVESLIKEFTSLSITFTNAVAETDAPIPLILATAAKSQASISESTETEDKVFSFNKEFTTEASMLFATTLTGEYTPTAPPIPERVPPTIATFIFIRLFTETSTKPLSIVAFFTVAF